MIVDEIIRSGIIVTHETENVLVAEVKGSGSAAGALLGHGGMRDGALIVCANSVNEFMRTVLERFPYAKQEKASDKPKDDYDGNFYFFNNLEEATEVYTNKPHTIRKFDSKDVEVRDAESNGNDIAYEVVGDFLDIGRYLEGLPDVFGNMVMGNPRNMFVDIQINMSAAAYVDQRAINLRAQRIMRLVDWLESQRIRTQITAIETTQCGFNLIRVKHANEPIDMDALAIVVHSDFLRRVRFRVTEWSKTFQYGYGSATQTPEKVTLDGQNLNIVIDWYGSETAVTDAMDKIEKQVEAALVEQGAIVIN